MGYRARVTGASFCSLIAALIAYLWMAAVVHDDYCDPAMHVEGMNKCKLLTVELINDSIKDDLKRLLDSDFFKFYKIDLDKPCKFWSKDEMCFFPFCTLNFLSENDVPHSLRTHDLSLLVFPREQPNLPVFRRYEYDEHDFCVVDGDRSKGSFVNLLDNPERFTGYAGAPAAKIWDAIFNENCFLDKPAASSPLPREIVNNQCHEKRIFFKIMSGFRCSVSAHIAGRFYNSTTQTWEHNFDIFHERIGKHPDRIQNMYLVFVLLLRATEKLCHRLEKYNFGLGDAAAEEYTKKLVLSIVHRPRSCPKTLDPVVFSSSTKPAVIEEFKNHFRNISLIMDCVGCEKCRLWGKIQVTGIGTALKILFASESPRRWENLNFRRSEIVALFNTLGRLSESISTVQHFRDTQRKKNNHADEGLLETVSLPAVEAVQIRDVLGKDIQFLGYVFNQSGGLVVVETSGSTVYSTGSPVLFENCATFGFIVDIFGPVAKPLYIVSPLEGGAHADKVGTPVYVCESLCKREVLEDGEVSEGSCCSLSDSEGAESADEK